MADLRIGNGTPPGIERFQALREEAMRRSRLTAAGAAAGKTPMSDAVNPGISTGTPPSVSRVNPTQTPDTRSPLGRLIDVRA